MGAVVGFNDQSGGQTGEVDPMEPDRDRAPEAKTFESPVTDQGPEELSASCANGGRV